MMSAGSIVLIILIIIVLGAMGGTALSTVVRRRRLRDLGDQDLEAYSARWDRVQERFVEAPSEAVAEAQSLVQGVMRERGYPITDHEQSAADVSVEHARVLRRFRLASAISGRAASGQVSTEKLKTAMLHYRELLDQLLASEGHTTASAASPDQ